MFLRILTENILHLSFMAKNRVHKGDFSKLSTGEFLVFTGPVEFVNRSGPAGLGPVHRSGSSSDAFHLHSLSSRW
jgi:hypothetical protein